MNILEIKAELENFLLNVIPEFEYKSNFRGLLARINASSSDIQKALELMDEANREETEGWLKLVA